MIEEAIEQYYVQQEENCEMQLSVNIWGEFAAKKKIQTPASGITFSRKQVFFGSVNHTYFGILWECTGLIV